jgi:hypothetical protein
LKRRFGIPLFFERSVIEIAPRRVLWWEDGRTSEPARVYELSAVS